MQVTLTVLLVIMGLRVFGFRSELMIQQEFSRLQYEVLERLQDARVVRLSSLAISVPKILSVDDTKELVCKVWETELARSDAELSVIDVYYDLKRDEYVPGLGTFDPPSSVERTRFAHKFATYRWSSRVSPAKRELTMIMNVDGTAAEPPKVLELEPTKDCSPRR